ncbi:MAG TPA: FmdB family zinc ribbon protein [Dehalococcoidia bacterium]|nr:FmdB family zinc ribbon protein [Dehalococcoidia bacterium]
MPIYEYRCPNGHQYEQWQSFSASPEHTCPTCGKPSKRVLSVPAVIFKGSGFYSTDNRRGGTVPSASPATESTPSESAAPGEPAAPAETAAPAEAAPAAE